MSRNLFFVFLLAAFLVSGQALAEKRVALVIGNNNYTMLPDLNNAKKDAKDIARKLKGLGFEVILKLNAKRLEMNHAIDEFSSRLESGDTGLVYFAGHGIQSDGRNYLIPSNAKVEFEGDLKMESLTANDFLVAMNDMDVGLSILILDACRDNPLPKRKRSAARGLSMVSVPQGANGTVILYAAAPGETAEDGPKYGNGVFTGELLKVLGRSGWSIEETFKETVKRVSRKTNKRQKPWINASITGDFYFKEGSAKVAMTPSGEVDKEAMFWNDIQGSDDPTDYKAYLSQYPDGSFAALANNMVGKLKQQPARKASLDLEYDISPLDEELYAVKNANVRSEPSAQSEKLKQLQAGSKAEVTGATNIEDAKWYRIALADGSVGFVFGDLLNSSPINQPPPSSSKYSDKIQNIVNAINQRKTDQSGKNVFTRSFGISDNSPPAKTTILANGSRVVTKTNPYTGKTTTITISPDGSITKKTIDKNSARGDGTNR